MRILFAEWNAAATRPVSWMLQKNGFAVDVVGTARDISDAVQVTAYDLMLISLSLPDSNGVDLIRAVRGMARFAPILAFAASPGDCVNVLNAGADDFMQTPFFLDELLARVRALLRRPSQVVGPTHEAGNLRLDVLSAAVTIGERPIILPRREMALLEVLMRNRPRPVSRNKLEQSIFTYDDDVTPNALEAAVSRLRRHLRHSEASVNVVATRGLGYSLSATS